MYLKNKHAKQEDTSCLSLSPPLSPSSPCRRAAHAAVEPSLEFVRKQHADTLSSLHAEVQLLRQKNSDLSFRLLGLEEGGGEAERTVAELQERERAAANAHTGQLAQLNALVAERDATIEALTQALEGSALRSSRAFEADLALRAAGPAQMVLQLHRAKLQYKETADSPAVPAGSGGAGALDPSEPSTQGAAPTLRPSPPKRAPPIGRLGGKGLFRRATYTNVDQTRLNVYNRSGPQPSPPSYGNPDRISPEPVGELPAYPEPVPPIGTTGRAE